MRLKTIRIYTDIQTYIIDHYKIPSIHLFWLYSLNAELLFSFNGSFIAIFLCGILGKTIIIHCALIGMSSRSSFNYVLFWFKTET